MKTHHHQCPLCDHIWEHERKNEDNEKLYAAQHTCPQCHSGEQYYICEKDGTPVEKKVPEEMKKAMRMIYLIFGD
jgi:hypothetical protein